MPVPRGVRILIATLVAARLGSAAQLVALGLLIFDTTGRELDLGLLGLAEFVPIFLLAPFSGAVADRFDRRFVFAAGLAVEIVATIGFFFVSRLNLTSVTPILAVAVVFGAARAFTAPASRALPIDMAPVEIVQRVVALRSVAIQIASIVGPIIAGLAFAVSRSLPFVFVVVAFVIALRGLTLVPATGVDQLASATGSKQALRDAFDGLRFMRGSPIVLGAITLDFFAVLFGGAVALLPAIGEKRLGADEAAIGFLYAATGVGALVTASILSIRPIRRHIGSVLFGVVGVFGIATIVLGATRSYAIAFLALLVLGVADSISVFIRATIVPLATPESMRGRVLAVENIFIGGSNELGGLESGLTAAWFGLTLAVVAGGVGTLAVVGVGMFIFPALRRVDRFEDVMV